MPTNGAFLPLLPSAPLPGAGWTVKVYAHTDVDAYAAGSPVTPIAQIFRYAALSWSPEIAECGAGSITLSLADPVFAYALPDGRRGDCLYRYDNLWVVFEDGQWRGEFWGEQVQFTDADGNEAAGRFVTIAGRGAAGVMQRGSVFSPYYPKTTPKGKIGVYQYKNVPVMSSWLDLLRACQRRGVLGCVRPQFSAVKDSAGVKWEDTPAPKPKNSAVAVVGGVNFTYDSAALTTAGQKAVAAIAAKLAKVTYPIVTVVGHTDSDGSTAYNQQKGLDRANTVANAILAIRPLSNVSVSSRGETQPIASNRTAAGRAKNRRVVVTYQSAPAYVDTIYTPERGTRMLDLLKQLTSGQVMAENRGPIHCEWMMGPRFALYVRSQFGTDKSRQVIYYQGSTALAAKAGTFDRTEVANIIAVQDDATAYQVQKSALSIARWGPREMYTRIEGSYSTAVHALIAATQRQAYADQLITQTLKIIPGDGRRPFRDFTIGDWIGVWHPVNGIDRVRVNAITVSVDAEGFASYELTLSTARQSKAAWLQTQIDALVTRKRGIRVFVQDDEPTGGTVGDLWTPYNIQNPT